MATEWKVEGDGPKTKIVANCPTCHTSATILNDNHWKAIHQRFRHEGCNGLAEPIPAEIREEYWKRAVV